jgi:single-strand DNA-binding protein
MAMSLDNQITLRGYVTAEPKLWQTKNNTTGAEVRVGSTPRWLNRETGEWQEGEPMYYTVKCWRNLAVNVKGSLHKGDRVIVRGKFMTRTWTDDQQRPRVQIEVEADSVGHDLAFAWSFVNRGARAPQNAMETLANGEMARAGLDGPDDSDEMHAERFDGDGSEGSEGSESSADARTSDLDGFLSGADTPGGHSDEYATEGASGELSAEVAAEALPF